MIKRDFALAVKGIIFKENKMLLLRRSRQEIEKSNLNRVDAWDLPGGGVQFFEQIKTGLTREVKEETNLIIKIIKPIDVHDLIRSHLHITIVTYLCIYEAGELCLSTEHDLYIWASIEELRDFNIPKWLLKLFERSITEYYKL